MPRCPVCGMSLWWGSVLLQFRGQQIHKALSGREKLQRLVTFVAVNAAGAIVCSSH